MFSWIKKYPNETIIGALVLLGHFYFTFFDFRTSSSVSPPKSSIIVKTHVQTPPPKKPSKTPPLVKKAPVKKNSSKGEVKPSVSPAKKPAPSNQVLTPPKEIQHLHIDQAEEIHSYLPLLVGCLHENLHLPDEGSVHVKLTILKNGRVEKLEVLYAESLRNKLYLERELAFLDLPPFTNELQGKLKHTFTLHFCNEN